jgi:hypothetical protein
MTSSNSKFIPKRHIPLSVTPYGSRNTLDMIESTLWSMTTIGSRKLCWSLCILRNSSLIRKRRISFVLSCDTRSYPRSDHRYHYMSISCSPSSDKSFNSSVILHPPWPSHTLASFIDAIVTEWAQSIYPSRGWTNPTLGAHPSTYSFGISKRHLFQSILLR